ncbi:MAG: Mur ligase family protein [Lactobacillus sp.]|jgi:UDP-N-acetylmuramoyl-L-alanyl-D-glutamate--2,6-diaminopimelate ligase|nr:Mur ligase family protein [Lactobacillus sp.]MCH3906526.1 Mur ligase family protein [Lactobacillus sp.]MCH3989897.1 Mur ligase family protein [Lactobacillus sp.]MCH4067937.1 Mur ligase family protein [Lactobacillus sp.]MCI1303624.1 Mur ligase family protein [Lactobacillus sp.]
MNFSTGLAKVAGKSSYWFLHNILKGGTSFPGKLALKIDPQILENLSKHYETIIVTGTNGKTMTTALIANIFRQVYGDVLTNPSGSNMQQGIVTAFLGHHDRSRKKIAVLEVDEANVYLVAKWLHPKAFVLTNIFRDQMDRYGEIYTTYDKIVKGIKEAPEAALIINGDANIFERAELPNPKIYYGFSTPEDKMQADLRAAVNTDGVLCPKCDHILHYHQISYASLGNYFCPNCGFHQPKLNYAVNKISKQTPDAVEFEIDHHPFSLQIGGTYNIYNALAAYATARTFGVSEDEAAEALRASKRVFGRQEIIDYQGKKINLILVKNPVGLNQVLSLLNTEHDDYTLAALLNAHHADGIDTSWIWDADFEALHKEQIKHVLVGGERYHDMGFRLEVAGFDPGKMITAPDDQTLLRQLAAAPTKKIYILATYTAMLALRQTLADQKVLKRRIN